MHAIDLTAAWDPPAAAGLPWTRRFGRPGGRAAAGRVWLVVAAAPVVPAATLNGVALEAAVAAGEVRWDVAALLRARNTLTLLPAAGCAGQHAVARGSGRQPLPPSCGRVRLEIA